MELKLTGEFCTNHCSQKVQHHHLERAQFHHHRHRHRRCHQTAQMCRARSTHFSTKEDQPQIRVKHHLHHPMEPCQSQWQQHSQQSKRKQWQSQSQSELSLWECSPHSHSFSIATVQSTHASLKLKSLLEEVPEITATTLPHPRIFCTLEPWSRASKEVQSLMGAEEKTMELTGHLIIS